MAQANAGRANVEAAKAQLTKAQLNLGYSLAPGNGSADWFTGPSRTALADAPGADTKTPCEYVCSSRSLVIWACCNHMSQ